MNITKFWLRVLGISGILGGLVLFAGDMLLYYDPISADLNQNMGNASDYRIIATGITALVAAWLYMLGLGQVFYAFKPTKPVIRNTVLVTFGSILIAFGIIHAAFVAIATSAKLAVENHLDIETATLLAYETNNTLRLFIYPIFAVLSFLFISQVWKIKTLYPRWMILFFPLIPFLLQDLICSYLSHKLWIVIYGGYLNLILVLFFTASTIALWNVKKQQIIK